MKAILSFFTVTICVIYSNFDNINPQPDIESSLIKKVFALKEVKQEEKQLQKAKGTSANISVYIYSKPTLKNPYYVIQVGYINSVRFEIYNNYRIDKKYVGEVPIDDFIDVLELNGQFIPLTKWRMVKAGKQ